MGLGSLIATAASLAAGTAAKTASNAVKKNNASKTKNEAATSAAPQAASTPTQSSTASTTGSNSSLGSQLAAPNFGLNSTQIKDMMQQANVNSQLWYDATPEEQKKLHQMNDNIYSQFGYEFDGSPGKWNPTALTGAIMSSAQANASRNDAVSALDQMKNEQQAANEAAVQQNVNALAAQKDAVQQAGEKGNLSAYQAYRQVTNPNGGLAERLAANGLISSGLTESSQIAAGNAYQGALNENQIAVQEQLAEIERAIVNARLTGDIASAEQLANYYTQVSNLAMENANAISSMGQWGAQYALDAANLTGVYNGLSTQQAQELEYQKKLWERQLAQGQITQEQFDRQFEATLKGMQEENRNAELNNQYLASQL